MLTSRYSSNKKSTSHILQFTYSIFALVIFLLLIPGKASVYGGDAKYIIFLLSDGLEDNHLKAVNQYTGTTPAYQQTSGFPGPDNWTKHWMSTFPDSGAYNSALAWSDFNYVNDASQESACTATGLFSGNKTSANRVNVSSDALSAFATIAEKALTYSLSSGIVSTVGVSNATTGGWFAHNDSRVNTYAIADEGIYGNPYANGTPSLDSRWSGGHYDPSDPSHPWLPTDVLIGTGESSSLSSQTLVRLQNESGQPDAHVLVKTQTGVDGANALMTEANKVTTKKLAGLFSHVYKFADMSGYNQEVPTLSESVTAALKVLSRNPNGFVLMIEGGAIDWAAHSNNMNQMIGEQRDFDSAVQTVIDWVNDPTNDSTWNNTLVVVTGDHSCGYLTAGPGVFPNQPIGPVNPTTVANEDLVSGAGGRRASWADIDADGVIDAGETVYWYWNSGVHTNMLIPLYIRGVGADLITSREDMTDQVRGPYLDNTEVFDILDLSMSTECVQTGQMSIIPGQTLYGNPVDLSMIVSQSNVTNLSYTVTENSACPLQTDVPIITKKSSWKYNDANGGNIGTDWMNTGYSDSGWLSGNGILGYGETYISTIVGNNPATQYSAYFRKTFNICDKNMVTSLKLNATYDDGMVVYINGVQVAAVGVSGNPPAWNGGAVGNESQQIYNLFNLTPYISNLVTGTNVIAVGVYNTLPLPSSDLVFDGELTISTNGTVTIFTGDSVQAQTANATGWTNGVKTLQVSGDDAICGDLLTPVIEAFTYDSTPVVRDSLVISNNTAIASSNPIETDQGVVMQRFEVRSNNTGNGQLRLAYLTLIDDGSSQSISDAKVYISLTSSATLPPGAVLIGNTGIWDGSMKTITLNGGTESDRTVLYGESKFIYIVYDLVIGQAGHTIKSHVSSVSVEAPDFGAGNVGTSNLLTIDSCNEPGSITITPGQTLYANPIDLTSIVNVTGASQASLVYEVIELNSTCEVEPGGTFIHAENFDSTTPGTGGVTFSFESSKYGYFGTGYLKGSDGPFNLTPPPVDERKDYQLYFPQAGTYKVWVRNYSYDTAIPYQGGDTFQHGSDMIWIGLNGNYVGDLTGKSGAIMTNSSVSQGQWKYYTVYTTAQDTQLDVVLKGLSADADLYVRKGETPTFTQYDCRPYNPNVPGEPATEQDVCVLPNNGATEWIIGVYGYQSTSFRLEALRKWNWGNTVEEGGTNTINIPAPGTYTINLWARGPRTFLDGIYLTMGAETPTDASHGLELDPATCSRVLFAGNHTAAQSINTTGWSEGTKTLTVTGTGLTCGKQLTPAVESFTYDNNTQPSSDITNLSDGALLTESNPDPFVITGTANDPDESVNHVEISMDGGTTWIRIPNPGDPGFTPNNGCQNCAGQDVTWKYSWSAANGSYMIISKAVDNRGLAEITGPVINVNVQRGGPVVTSTVPLSNASYVVPNTSVTINWDKNIDCSTVTTSSVTISPAPSSWTISSCSGTQAQFTPTGQAEVQIYTVTVSTTVKDSAGNNMPAQYQFAYTTGELTPPTSSITTPAADSKINSSAPNPYTITGTASDNAAVTGVEISIDSGAWVPVTSCTNCGTANATWTYSWALPGDGLHNIRTRAKDTSNNLQNPVTSISVTVDRTSPSVSMTDPVNGATGLPLNQDVTITWNTNVNCTTVNTTTITSNNPNWTRTGCGGNTAFFTTSGQAAYTLYTVTVKSGASGVKNSVGLPMSDDYVLTYRTNQIPTLSILQPDGTNDSLKAGNLYNITYNLSDPDHVVTAAFYYDTDNSGYDGTAISGECSAATEGSGMTCAWNTTGMNSSGMPPKTYYVYGKTNDPLSGEVKTYSLGQITIYSPNEPPTLSISEPNGTDDTILSGDIYNINYTLTDPNIDDTVTVQFYHENTSTHASVAITGPCATAPEGTNLTCAWNTTGLPAGNYNIYGITSDGIAAPVQSIASGPVAIVSTNTLPTLSITEPDGIADAIKPGGSYAITYNLSDPDEAVFAEFRYDTDKDDSNGIGTLITGCTSAPEGTGAVCQWNTTGVAAGNYYIFARVKDRTLAWITDYSGNNNSDPAVGKITIDATSPSTVINAPINGAVLNSSASDPYTISGTATDNLAVQSVEVSVNSGAWTPALCTGCGTANATWTYSWSLPADGPYTIQSRANDLATNVETPSAGKSVTIDRTRPLVSTTTPVNAATAIAPDSSVTINWNEAMDCSTVSASSVTISPSVGWTRTSCSGSQAIFAPNGQADSTTYTVTVTTGVKDVAGNSINANYSISFTTNVPPVLSVSKPDGTEGIQTKGNPYYITYTLNDPDNTITAALYYDANNSGTDGVAIPGCSAVPEGTNVTCMWDTSGMTPGTYYIYGTTSDGIGGSCLARTWDGEGTDNLASTAANWSDNAIPQNGEDVVFNGTSVKNSDWNINVELLSLSLNSGYTGTVTVNSPLTIGGNLIISDGTLIQNENVTVSGQGGSCSGQGGSQISTYSIGQVTIGTAGITVSAISGNTTEAGGTATFTVVLDSQPTDNVTIGLSSSDLTEGTVSTASLTFTAGNWSTPQTVTVTGVDDLVQDGPVAYTIVTAAASSSDAKYSGLNAADVSVTNSDNDGAGITVTPTSGLVTTEADVTATFMVVLNSQPTADVTIGLSSDDTTEGTVSPASLTFTSANWSTPQTVTVTGVNDSVQDGNIVFNIVTAQATSTDGNYSVINPANVIVTNNDNDVAGVTVGTISGNTTEAGGTATFTVVLNSQPTADVVIGLSSDDTTEGTVSPASLTFTAGNWSTPQTVTVTGVNDSVQDGNIVFNIVTAQATSTDGNYSVINPADVSVTNNDNDVAGVTVGTISGNTTEAGGTATFTVVLNSQPTADVVIGLSSDNTTEGTVSPASLTFTAGNWSTPQTVTVTGVNDSVQDGNIVFNIETAQASSTDGNYSVINPANVSVTNNDNDVAGVSVGTISGNTTEAGGTATFTVVLNSQPTADVMIGLSSDDTTEGTVSPASLTFTAGNWSTPQTVTVTGVNDSVQDGNIIFNIETAQASSTDGNYSVINPANVSVTNNDNDVIGVTVSTISANITEAGGTATFTVVLNTQPTADVTIGLSSSDTTEGTVSLTSLTFTTGNWSTPQTVTVTGVNDNVDDGDVLFNITTAAATSSDASYNGLNPADVNVTNTDNDTAGISVYPYSIMTTESGGVAFFWVKLDSEPTANVTIGLSSSDATEGTVSPASLTFTPLNWNTRQWVTVTGVNDSAADGNIIYTIMTAQATSSDGIYSAINPTDVSATNMDNDAVGITVTPTSGLLTTEVGGTATFTIVLNSEPASSVTIGLSSSDTTEGSVSPSSLTFTTGNWNTPQTVTVTGVNDSIQDGNVSYTIITAPATSTDAYNGLNPADVSVTNNDDSDSAGVTVGTISGNTTEAGGTATFTVVLNSQPTADVVIGLSSDDTTEGTVSPASLTFTAGNWSTPQTVTVTGVNDSVQDGNIVFNIVTAQATSSDGNYSVINPANVSVTNNDNDVAGVTVGTISGSTTEAGGTATFTVVLNSQPTADVVIGLSSDDTTEGTVSPASLTFTAGNWSTPQTVTVTGVNDSVQDGNIVFNIVTAQATSSDGNYSVINPADVSVTNNDNDVAGVTVGTISGNTTEAGGTATYTVVLNSQPTADVVIGLSSDDTTEGTVSPASLTFTSGNWSTPQMVTVTGVNDDVQDGNIAFTIETAQATSSDSNYSVINPADVSVTNNDNDMAGVTVGAISGNTTEAGGTATFTVVLNSQPTADVVIGLSSDDTTEGTVSPASLTFTAGNWSTPQMVTVTGVNDSVQDGNIVFNIVTAQATSSDGNYSVINPDNVSVTNNDDSDSAGVTVGAISGNTTEAGGTATFTVVLNSQPTANVTIGLSSDDVTEGTVSPASLTFTSGNWSTPQTVTVTGVNDSVQDGNIVFNIETAQATSTDGNYSVINPANVSVTNNDDSDSAGITVGAISGNTTEAGGTATFTVVLNSQPTADVVIGLSSDDTTEGTVLPASLTFTAGNWSTPQTVTVTGVNDSVQDGNIVFNIETAQATSTDGNYSVINPADVSVTNNDNDVAGVSVGTISGNTTEAGGTATFTVVLNSQPTADVVIGLSSDDTTEGTVSPASLTFTAGNWSTPQTVTVTGVNDLVQDGNIVFNIETAQATSTDGNYSVINPADVSVTNNDNDVAGVSVGTISGNTTEAGGTATYTVVLNSQPTADVTIGLSSDDTTEGTVSPASLTFTSGSWSTPQMVTVTGVNDDVQDGNIAFTIETAQATSSDSNYSVINPADVSVTNNDNDVAGVTVGAISGNTTEAGGTATFTVVLNSQPTADVVIGLSSDDTTEGTVSPASLTFTAGNWSTPQTVAVTGVNDSVQDGNIAFNIVTAQATSSDGNYSVINPDNVSVMNNDNDVAGVTVGTISGNTTEAGGTATFTVVLNSQPTADVVIGLSSDDTTEGTVSPASLTFTAGNWSTPQTVTVTGQDDLVDDGNIAFNIVTAQATSTDGNYSVINPANVSVTNNDNDTAGITVIPTSGVTTSEHGWSNFFWVKLNSEPTGNVTIGLTSDDTTEGTITDPSSASLTFTPDDWYIEQWVEITGMSDGIDDGDVIYHIITAPATSTDTTYNGMNSDDVSITNSDID